MRMPSLSAKLIKGASFHSLPIIDMSIMITFYYAKYNKTATNFGYFIKKFKINLENYKYTYSNSL